MTAKSFPITLKDGKTRQLRYEWTSLCRLKREQGISAFDVARKQLFGSIDPVEITALLWAGFIFEEPKLTVAEVEDLMDINKTLEYLEVIGDAITEAIYGPEKAEEVKKAVRSSLEGLAGMSTSKKATT